MDIFEIIKNCLEIIIPLATLILVGIGLRMWKIQLKGENTYKLSLDILRELKLTLNAIDDYRHPYYSPGEKANAFCKRNDGKLPEFMGNEDNNLAVKYAEIDRWNKIIDRFDIYTDSVLKLAVSINNYEIDLVNGRQLKDYLIEMNIKRSKKEFADDDKIQLSSMNEKERVKLREECLQINKVLMEQVNGDDLWGQNLKKYFDEMNKRLRKYTK